VGEYRRITRTCAVRDWKASTHDEAVDRNGGNHLLQRFLTDKSLDHCYAGSNVLDRARDRPKGAPSPGAGIIGNFHIKAPAARRAWVWRDTGELDPAWADFTIDWMIAEGPRRQGDRTDLQKTHADILHDPHDAWRPLEADYADLADRHEKLWLDRARHAVRIAVHEAGEHPGRLIPVDIDQVAASIAQDFPEDFSVRVDVVEELTERWIIVNRLGSDKRPIDPDTALTLAGAAFDGISAEDIMAIQRKTTILAGAHVIDPAHVYAWSAIV